MASSAQPKETLNTPTLVGWQGIRFTLPPEWNVTGFSTDRDNGYLKVDSPGTMFVQVKWNDPRAKRPRTLGEWLFQLWKKRRRKVQTEPPPPDLRAMLDQFMKQTEKIAKKSKKTFDFKVKSETTEADGERSVMHFHWSGGGQGQGKIWHCKGCGRTVIAQVVGQPRDNIAAVASQVFSGFQDHSDDGWEVWGLYDLVAAVPSDFRLKKQKLMSGYLRLDFERRGGERMVIERWGLANVARKKFTLSEWFRQTAGLDRLKVTEEDAVLHEHPAVTVRGTIRGVFAWAGALRDALFTWRPATRYEGCCWECPESNKIYAIQVRHNARTPEILEEAAIRCECH